MNAAASEPSDTADAKKKKTPLAELIALHSRLRQGQEKVISARQQWDALLQHVRTDACTDSITTHYGRHFMYHLVFQTTCYTYGLQEYTVGMLCLCCVVV